MSNTVAEFIAKFPERYIEVGIAETNSVSLAAGLASAGLIPYIYSMSPFGMLKTCEQWRTDVDYNHLPVRLVGRLSGLAMGYFGTSHYAVEDIAIARTMNNTVVLSPADAASCISLMRSTAALENPVYIRIAEARREGLRRGAGVRVRQVAAAALRRRRHADRARHGRRARRRRRGGAALRARQHRGRRVRRRLPAAVRRDRAAGERARRPGTCSPSRSTAWSAGSAPSSRRRSRGPG